jgi:hypothetical protein
MSSRTCALRPEKTTCNSQEVDHCNVSCRLSSTCAGHVSQGTRINGKENQCARTWAPSSRKRSAVARPMPDVAPVTSTRFPKKASSRSKFTPTTDACSLVSHSSSQHTAIISVLASGRVPLFPGMLGPKRSREGETREGRRQRSKRKPTISPISILKSSAFDQANRSAVSLSVFPRTTPTFNMSLDARGVGRHKGRRREIEGYGSEVRSNPFLRGGRQEGGMPRQTHCGGGRVQLPAVRRGERHSDLEDSSRMHLSLNACKNLPRHSLGWIVIKHRCVGCGTFGSQVIDDDKNPGTALLPALRNAALAHLEHQGVEVVDASLTKRLVADGEAPRLHGETNPRNPALRLLGVSDTVTMVLQLRGLNWSTCRARLGDSAFACRAALKPTTAHDDLPPPLPPPQKREGAANDFFHTRHCHIYPDVHPAQRYETCRQHKCAHDEAEGARKGQESSAILCLLLSLSIIFLLGNSCHKLRICYSIALSAALTTSFTWAAIRRPLSSSCAIADRKHPHTPVRTPSHSSESRLRLITKTRFYSCQWRAVAAACLLLPFLLQGASAAQALPGFGIR